MSLTRSHGIRCALALALISGLARGPALAWDPDYSASVGFQTFPWGAAAVGRIGLNRGLWGATPSSGGRAPSPWYGYLRSFGRLQSSGVVTSPELGLEIFPVSIIGFGLSQAFTHRNTTLSTLDCARIECRGWLHRTKAYAQGVVGHRAFFGLIDISYEWLRPGTGALPFGDELSSLEGRSGGDSLVRLDLRPGVRLSDSWASGLYFGSARMLQSGNSHAQGGIFGAYATGPWAFGGILGLYRSSTASLGANLGLQATWIGRRSYSLR